MRKVMPSDFQLPRPHRITRGSKQMREKRTALIAFGVVLACVELYVIFGAV